MRILHITNTYIPEDGRILKAMDCYDQQSHSIFGAGVLAPEKSRPGELPSRDNIVSIPLIIRKLKFLPRLVRKFIEPLELMVRVVLIAVKFKPELIHCHDVPALPTACIVKLLTRARLVYDTHELSSDKNGLSRWAGVIIFRVERLLWPIIDGLIVVSPSIGTWYKNHFSEKSTFVVINSPRLSDIHLDKPTNYLRQHFGISNSSKIYIYVGILNIGRSIDIISRVFDAYEGEAHVVFLGYGEFADDLRNLASSSPRIHFHEPVAHDEVVPIIRSADVGLCLIEPVSLSDKYCLPNKLFEYILAELPVIASNLPDITMLLSSYGGGICIENGDEALTDAITAIEQGRVELPLPSPDAKDLAWEQQRERLRCCYETLVGGSV
jgi:glycosyltransferase involved in cell wall biosynthesis